MILEYRYLVIKLRDGFDCLTDEERATVDRIFAKVQSWRREQGKEPLGGLFIERDWPEYEPTLKMLSYRFDAGTKSDQHEWDADGEKCIKCGDKDWMGTKCDGVTK